MKGKMRLLLAAGFVLAITFLICSQAMASDETESASMKNQGDALLGSKEARVFDGTLDSAYTLTTWDVEGQEDVPYVSLEEYMNIIFSDAYLPSLEFSWDGNVYAITQNGQSIFADLDSQTIWCDNWRAFQGPNAARALPAGIVEKNEFVALRPSEKHESTQTDPSGYEVHLADYSLEMIRHEDDVLMPFAAAQSVFGAPFMRGVFSYNGDDYYDIVNCVGSIYGNGSASSNPYADRYYSGRFTGSSQMSEAYAKYNYESMCLMLDLTYGHKEEKGITTFDAYLEKEGLKEAFLTPDPVDEAESLKKMFSVLFDSGHDAELLTPSIFDSEGIPGRQALVQSLLELIGYDSMQDLGEDLSPVLEALAKLANHIMDGAFEEMIENKQEESGEDASGPNMQQLLKDALHMKLLKPLFYGNNKFEIVGDTCVIYFEQFEEDLTRSESFYTKLPNRDDMKKSSFALFYYAFEQIKKDGNVKNVVFDVSNNGGGSAAALVSLLGFLSQDGEVNITYRDLLNKNYVSEWYHVDTNLDGVFDDRDGYGGQYSFYIMTSGTSYSCGNAFPYFAQREGLAKVIGKKPGGGDCVVGFYVDASGHVGAISGFLQLGTMEGETFISDEHAVEMDLPMTDQEANEIFFHPEKIAQFIAQDN